MQSGENVNEVEAAGNTPLHAAAYEGWIEGAELLLGLGAKVSPSKHLPFSLCDTRICGEVK